MPYTSSCMPKLSEKDLHDRAIKGWKTRRMHKPTKKQVAGGLAGTYVGVKLNSGRRLLRHQYEWHRPSGEVVPIRGFNKKHIDNITPALHEVDQYVDPEKATLHNFSAIERRNMGPIAEMRRAGAVYIPGKVQMPFLLDEMGYTKEEQKGAMRLSKVVHGTKMSEKGKIVIPSRSFRNQEAGVGGLLQHELGHAFDHAVLHSEGSSHPISSDMEMPEKGYSSRNATYQDSQQIEDFAESFRGRLGDLAGARRPVTIGPMASAIKPDFYNPDITPHRRKFMDEKMFRDIPGDAGHIVEKAGVHQHTNHLLIGAGMLAGGAAITYHQRHAEDRGASE